MRTPVDTEIFNNFANSTSYTNYYTENFPSLGCDNSFIMTVVDGKGIISITDNMITTYTGDHSKIGTHTVKVKVMNKAEPYYQELIDELVIEIQPPCVATSYKPVLRLNELVTHEVPKDGTRQFPFNIRYEPAHCNLNMTFHVKINGTEGFPSWNRIDRWLLSQLDPIFYLHPTGYDIGIYEVEVYGSLNYRPKVWSTENIVSEFIIYGDPCTRTRFYPLPIEDMYVLIQKPHVKDIQTFEPARNTIEETTSISCGPPEYKMSGVIQSTRDGHEEDPPYIEFNANTRTFTV